jgi:hypothetical protein
MLSLALAHDYIERFSKIYCSLVLPPLAMAEGAITFCNIEFGSIGITFDTWGDLYQQFSVKDSIVTMTVSAVGYAVLGFYLENVWPSQYGERK